MAASKITGKSGTWQDWTGKTFGLLRVIGFAECRRGHSYWKCLCSCGKEKVIRGNSLQQGKTRSCGCTLRHGSVEGSHSRTKHGQASKPGKTEEYRAWVNMCSRCRNPQMTQFKDYGGRGIQVCERWLLFENFFADVGPRPGAKYSLDRIDNDGPYCKENCRWATVKEQHNNTNQNRHVSFRGEQRTVAEWAELLGLSYWLIRSRLDRGWSSEEAFTTPKREAKKQGVFK